MKIHLPSVKSVYSGVNGKCCCGCSGKHTYAERLAGKGKEVRGYDFDAKELNDKTIRLICKKIEAADPDRVEVASYGVTAIVGNRLYIAYTE